jgi:hypothetical protein
VHIHVSGWVVPDGFVPVVVVVEVVVVVSIVVGGIVVVSSYVTDAVLLQSPFATVTKHVNMTGRDCIVVSLPVT